VLAHATTVRILFLIIAALALANPNGNIAAQPSGSELATKITERDFPRLLSQVKALQKRGARTYFQAEAQALTEDFRPISPKLIIVRRNSVEFFLNSDLDKPQVLTFSRVTGVWSPRAVLWVADLKSPAKNEELRLWDTKEEMSDAELDIERQLNSLGESSQKTLK
jgi:hypothetical protein